MRTVLETPRLRLREVSREDLDFIAAMRSHPEVMRFYPKIYSREESAEWIERQLDRYARHGHGLWLVEDRLTAEPRGAVGLVMQEIDGTEEPEIGYMIHYPYWRLGLATEAALATRDWAFETRGLARVISLIRPENLPSQGVARNLGMTQGRCIWIFGFDHIVFEMKRP
jgi:ribosomal-protein-alanine N-acetyltransferase